MTPAAVPTPATTPPSAPAVPASAPTIVDAALQPVVSLVSLTPQNDVSAPVQDPGTKGGGNGQGDGGHGNGQANGHDGDHGQGKRDRNG